jgi:Tol biopolymer transport system component
MVALLSAAALSTSHVVFTANHVPKLYGEIYRVAPDGARIDLSRSPAADVDPAVSPDGKRVAFVSTRAGHVRVYVVGSERGNLRAVSPPLMTTEPNGGPGAEIAWSPDGRRLAVELEAGSANPTLYLAGLDGGWRTVTHRLSSSAPVWSRDGTRVAYSLRSGLVVVADPVGRTLWRVGGTLTPAWSKSGRLAVQQNSTTIDVYDGHGKHLSELRGGSFAWSPNGRTLATMNSGVLQLHSGGAGRSALTAQIFRKPRVTNVDPIDWVSATRLRVFGGADGLWHGYDVARRRAWSLPPALRTSSVVSARGVAASTAYDPTTTSLLLAGRPVATAASCSDDTPFVGVQFVGRTNALVYQSGCALPSADVYSVAPDGSDLQQITATPTHEFDPALSPEGSRIAYVDQQVGEKCDGCPQSLWLTSPTEQLTDRQYSDDAPFDEDPSWSPDGSTLVFDRSGPNVQWGLFTVPAAGGPARDLEIGGAHPAWGPKLIAFVREPGPGIATLDPSTGEVRTVVPGIDPSYLAWSPDGRLAYFAYTRGGHPTIAIAGSPVKIDLSRLLPPKSVASGLAWSPDGTRFAFAATDGNGVGEIYTVRTDGTRLVQVTHDLGAVYLFSDLSWH